ncbi:hypothetical protein PT276_06005 [Orbaceae bacterium ESL0721]|nr:hypothetical protein [Orbaceae bacterium ESL0721]
MLDITLSNGITYSSAENPSFIEKPIELPKDKQSFNDITMTIPSGLNQIALNDLVHNRYWGDDNGDGENGVNATGSVTMAITNVRGEDINRADLLNACDAPYKLTLTGSGILNTTYGDPNSRDLGTASVTYYLKPKEGNAFACWAEPNLAYSGTVKHPFAASDAFFDYTLIDGPAKEWNPKRGFLLQSITNPATNFPTMGAYGLFFYLTVGNTFGKNITYNKTPASSGLDLKVTDAGNNVAKVMLIGPRDGASKTVAQTAVPTTFTLYADKSAIYSFKISKWFIAKKGDGGGFNANYCNNSYGANYRIPNTVEYTNANDSSKGWTGGLAGQSANYQRRIGGGLFAEWGNMDNYGRWGYKSIYQDSDFDDVWYWASEPYDAGGVQQRYVDSYGGWVAYRYATDTDWRFACVTP